MSRFKRPNPDQWSVADTVSTVMFGQGELRIELWERVGGDDDQQWVLVCDGGGADHRNQHAPLNDKMVGLMLRVMRDE